VIPVSQALAQVLEATRVLGSERVSLAGAAGRVVAEEVVSSRTVPAAPNSAMDGWAVRHADVASAPATLRVIGEAPAGPARDRRVDPGTAIKIFTGSVVPPGADTVVRVEYSAMRGSDVVIEQAEPLGANIRLAGEDIAQGMVVLAAGTLIGPADVGVLASVGRSAVAVHRRPRVAILSTGAELVEVDETPGPGQVVNSNAWVLAAAATEAGADATVWPIVRDRFEDIRDHLAEAATADVVLSTGGVSVGDYDFVNEALAAVGVEPIFWRVAQKPGKPLSFGRRGSHIFFGLPGNPVSALVCFYVYVRPALRKLGGHARLHLPMVQARLAVDTKKAKDLTEFVRVRLDVADDGPVATPFSSQSSGVLTSLGAGASLLVGPAAERMLTAGTQYPVLVATPETLARADSGSFLD
jgi:molybdopterin molybdotransferase